MSIELDHLDKLAASVFDGYPRSQGPRAQVLAPVSGADVRRRVPPRAATAPATMTRLRSNEGLQIVEKQLKDRTVRTGEEELFKARAKERARSRSSISSARDSTRRTTATWPSCRASRCAMCASTTRMVRDHERMLTDGFYAEVTLELRRQ
jgi:ATP-dependent Lon protease